MRAQSSAGVGAGCGRMTRMRCHLRFVAVVLLAGLPASGCGNDPAAPAAQPPASSDADFTGRVNTFIDEWHDDAAHEEAGPPGADQLLPHLLVVVLLVR